MLNDKDKMILSTLDDIKTSIELITQRCKDINSSDDFLDEEDGPLKLDSISIPILSKYWFSTSPPIIKLT